MYTVCRQSALYLVNVLLSEGTASQLECVQVCQSESDIKCIHLSDHRHPSRALKPLGDVSTMKLATVEERRREIESEPERERERER